MHIFSCPLRRGPASHHRIVFHHVDRSSYVRDHLICTGGSYHGIAPHYRNGLYGLIRIYQTDLNVGYVMGCILPVFFVRIASSDRANGSAECIRAVLASHLQGLAQCLITARVAYTESVKQNQPPEASFPLTPQSSIRASTLAINVKKEVHQWTDTLKTDNESMGRDVMHSPSFESGAC